MASLVPKATQLYSAQSNFNKSWPIFFSEAFSQLIMLGTTAHTEPSCYTDPISASPPCLFPSCSEYYIYNKCKGSESKMFIYKKQLFSLVNLPTSF